MRLPNDLCRRSVEYISRELDGDLAEFEHALLRAHLNSCLECSAIRERIGAQTAELRMAPLEPLGRQIALPAARRHGLFGGVAAATAAVAAAALAAVSVGVFGHVGDSAVAQRVLPAGAIESHATLPKSTRLTAMRLSHLSRQPTRITNRGYNAF